MLNNVFTYDSPIELAFLYSVVTSYHLHSKFVIDNYLIKAQR